MASQTTILHLKKPALDDDALITDINNNMDLIDAFAGNVGIQATSSMDLNDYTGTVDRVQYYKGSNIQSFTNKPPYTWTYTCPFVLEVIKISSYTKQILHVYLPENLEKQMQHYERQQTYMNGGVGWGGWVLLEDANSNIGIVANGDTAPKAITQGQYVIWNGALCTANSAIASGATLSSSNLTSVADGGLNSINYNTIKRTTATATTGSTGNVAFPLVVIDVKANGYICLPFMSSTNEGYVKVLDMTTLQPVANTQIDFVIYYKG